MGNEHPIVDVAWEERGEAVDALEYVQVAVSPVVLGREQLALQLVRESHLLLKHQILDGDCAI